MAFWRGGNPFTEKRAHGWPVPSTKAQGYPTATHGSSIGHPIRLCSARNGHERATALPGGRPPSRPTVPLAPPPTCHAAPHVWDTVAGAYQR